MVTDPRRFCPTVSLSARNGNLRNASWYSFTPSVPSPPSPLLETAPTAPAAASHPGTSPAPAIAPAQHSPPAISAPLHSPTRASSFPPPPATRPLTPRSMSASLPSAGRATAVAFPPAPPADRCSKATSAPPPRSHPGFPHPLPYPDRDRAANARRSTSAAHRALRTPASSARTPPRD